MSNPPFNNARGFASTLQMMPPFTFQDMVVCGFPVHANRSRTQAFIDQYLNQVDQLPGQPRHRFEVLIPYVYLMFLDYGKMAIDAANMGWVSQQEVCFGIPLKWLEENEDGEWEFKDWAFTTPYIYVDNPISMTTGRVVYGWPKVLGRMHGGGADWLRDPEGPQQAFQLDVSMIEDAFADDAAEYHPFIRVRHTPAPDFLSLPLSFSGLLDPLLELPNLAMSATRMSIDLLQTFAGIGTQGITGGAEFPDLFDAKLYTSFFERLREGEVPTNPEDWGPGMQALLWALFPRMAANTINLKQFRDAGHPQLACYQSVNNSKMGFLSFNAGGLLGQKNLWFGNTNGGYEIEVYRYDTQAAVDALGLVPDDTREVGGQIVDIFKPVFPYWFNLDMSYGRGKAIATRSATRSWFTEAPENSEKDSEQDEKAAEDPTTTKPEVAKTVHDNRYNTARGAALQELVGPFEMPNATYRVMPLLADPEQLNHFVGEYLNVPGEYRFEAWGSTVYVVASNYTLTPCDSNRIGLFPAREVSILVPVRRFGWYRWDPKNPHDTAHSDYDLTTEAGRAKRDAEQFQKVQVTIPFNYTDNATLALTATEVNGVPTMSCDVASPEHTWMESAGPALRTGANLLDVSALVLPSVGTGSAASDESFLNVNTRSLLPASDPGWDSIIESWGNTIADDLERKYGQRGYRDEQYSESDAFRRARAWGLEVLTGKLSIQNVALKQFRHSWDTEDACYQAIVQRRTTIDRIYEIHEIDETLHVDITQFPSQPVAKVLGLIPKHRAPGSNVESFQAIRPFWFRADVTEHLGETVLERTGTTQWTRLRHPLEHPFGFTRPEGKDDPRKAERPLMSYYKILDHVDRHPIVDLRAFLDAATPEQHETTTFAELGTDTGEIGPSTILDSYLSRQWAKPEGTRHPHNRADFCLHARSFGPYGRDVFPQHERQGMYWPRSQESAWAEDNEREGMAWQLWNDVWDLIDLGEKDCNGFEADARRILPDWFTDPDDGTLKRSPRKWSASDWTEIGHALRDLVEASRDTVNYRDVLRFIAERADEAIQCGRELSLKHFPDAALGAVVTKDNVPQERHPDPECQTVTGPPRRGGGLTRDDHVPVHVALRRRVLDIARGTLPNDVGDAESPHPEAPTNNEQPDDNNSGPGTST